MSKQTSIEWLFAHLVPHLDWSKVEDRELFRKLKAEAQQMHKEEIEDAYGDGINAYRVDFCNREEYYQKTYGNEPIGNADKLKENKHQ